MEDAFKTSMGPYLAYFQDQFLTPLMEAHSTDRRGVTPVVEEANLEAKMELEEA